jgi:hypothetical protein
VSKEFLGACQTSFQDMQACYLDASACADAGEHDWVVAYLQPFIDAKVLTVDQIPQLQELYYQFIYQ